MYPNILHYTLIFGIWISLCKYDVNANIWRKSLQKEVLLNSIQYLRGHLFGCLKATQGGREKRKVTEGWYAELRLEMDIDILRNTQAFLEERVIECRKKLSSGQPDTAYIGLEEILLAKNIGCQSNDKVRMHKPRIIEEMKPAVVADMSVVDIDDNAGRMSEGQKSIIVSTLVAPSTIGTTTTTTTPTTTTMPTTTTTTTIAATTHAPAAKFLLDGQYITCGDADVENSIFRCRDLRLSGELRLPNLDYCPPTYIRDRWRAMEEMSDRTSRVLDLLDLCAVIGQRLRVNGFTKHVRVVWGCDQLKPRMSWQNGQWSGLVKDNGYLHDLECTYSSRVDWSPTDQ